MQDDTYFARLVSLACHDVRTPLATVHGFALTLMRTLALAHAAAERLGDDHVHVSGEGAIVATDTEAVDRGFSALVQAALRHGGLEEVNVLVPGTELDVSPITEPSAPVVLGQDLRDLGA